MLFFAMSYVSLTLKQIKFARNNDSHPVKSHLENSDKIQVLNVHILYEKEEKYNYAYFTNTLCHIDIKKHTFVIP